MIFKLSENELFKIKNGDQTILIQIGQCNIPLDQEIRLESENDSYIVMVENLIVKKASELNWTDSYNYKSPTPLHVFNFLKNNNENFIDDSLITVIGITDDIFEMA